jgi:hypothetical protein
VVISAQAIGVGFGKPQDFSGLQARFILLGMSQSLSSVLIHIDRAFSPQIWVTGTQADGLG